MDYFGLEADPIEGDEPKPEVAADLAAPPVPSADGKTAAEPETAGEEQEVTEGIQTETERDETGKFKAKEVPAGVQKKIDKATKAQREAERDRDEARENLVKLQKDIEDLKKATAAKPADAPKEEPKPEPVVRAKPKAPKLEDFSSNDDPFNAHQEALSAFQEALMDWKLEQKDVQNQKKLDDLKTEVRNDTVSEAEKQERIAAFEVRKADARTFLPDFDATFDAAKDFDISAVMADAIGEYAEDGGDILFLYYLAKNPGYTKELTEKTGYDPKKASPEEVLGKNRLAAREFARIEKEVLALRKAPETKEKTPAAPAKPPTRATKAPAPIEPVQGGGAPSAQNPNEMTSIQFREHLKTASGRDWWVAQGGSLRDLEKMAR